MANVDGNIPLTISAKVNLSNTNLAADLAGRLQGTINKVMSSLKISDKGITSQLETIFSSNRGLLQLNDLIGQLSDEFKSLGHFDTFKDLSDDAYQAYWSISRLRDEVVNMLRGYQDVTMMTENGFKDVSVESPIDFVGASDIIVRIIKLLQSYNNQLDLMDSALRNLVTEPPWVDFPESLNATATSANATADAVNNVNNVLLESSQIDASSALQSYTTKTITLRQILSGMGTAFRAVGHAGVWAFTSLGTSANTLHSVFQRLVPIVEKVKSIISKIGVVMSALGSAAKRVFGTIGSGVKALAGRFSNLKKSADSSLDGFGKKAKRITLQMVKAMIGVRGLYMLFRKMKSAFTESFNSMAEAVPEVNAVMTEFKGALNNVKMSLATAFQPILQVVLPILTSFLNVISRVLVALGNFFAILTGQGYIYEWTDATNGYADAIGNTGKAAKKAKRDLMGFDEINRLSEKDTGSGGGGSGGGAGGGGDYSKIPATDPNGAISKFIERIKAAWKASDFTDIGAWIGEKIKSGLDSFQKWLKSNKGLAENAGKSLATFLNGIFTVKGLGTSFGQTLGEIINLGLTGAHSFLSYLDFTAAGELLGDALQGFFNESLDWNLLGSTFAEAFNGVFDFIGGANAKFDLGNLAQNITDTMNNVILYEIDWENMSSTVSDTFNNVLNGVNTAVANFDFFGAGTKIFGALNDMLNNGIDWDGLGTLFGNSFNSIFDIVDAFNVSFDLTAIGAKLADALNTMINTMDIGKATASVSTAIVNLLEGGITFIKDTDWSGLGRKIMVGISNIDFVGVVGNLGTLVGDAGKGVISLIQGGLDYMKNNDGWKKAAQTAFDALEAAWNGLDLKNLIVNASLAVKGIIQGSGEFLIQCGRIITTGIENIASEAGKKGADYTAEREVKGKIEFSSPKVDAAAKWSDVIAGWMSTLGASEKAIDSFRLVALERLAWADNFYKWFGGTNEKIVANAVTINSQVDEILRKVGLGGKSLSELTSMDKQILSDMGYSYEELLRINAQVDDVSEGTDTLATNTMQAGNSFDTLSAKSADAKESITGDFNDMSNQANQTASDVEKSGQAGFGSLGKYGSGTINDVTSMMHLMPDAVKQSLADAENRFGLFSTNVGQTSAEANRNMENAFSNTGIWANGRLTSIMDSFNKLPSEIGEKSTSGYNNMTSAFDGTDKFANQKLDIMKQVFGQFSGFMKQTGLDANADFTGEFAGLQQWSETKLMDLMRAWDDGSSNGLSGWFGTTANNAYGAMTDELTQLVEFMAVTKDEMIHNLDDGSADGLVGWFGAEGTESYTAMAVPLSELEGFSQGVYDTLRTNIDDGSSNGMVGWFGDEGTNAYSAMTTPFDNTEGFAKDRWDAFKTGFGFGTTDSPMSTFSEQFTTAYNTIDTIFSGMGGMAEANWNQFKNGFSEVSTWFPSVFGTAWSDVEQVFSKGGSVFQGMSESVLEPMKGIVNRIIEGTNQVVKNPFEGLNNRLRKLSEIEILGMRPFSWIKSLSIPQIPKLAKGGVIPPNKSFLAVLGDQKRGTNVEAPLETIQQAVADVMGSNNAEMMRGFAMVVDAINRKNLVIGDKEIGKAASRFNNRESIRRGYAL